MKSLKLFMISIISLILFITIGCKADLDGPYSNNITEDSSQIAKNIQMMKENGLFDDILFNNCRSTLEEDKEHDMMVRFINDTDSVLEEIASTETGEQDLKIINALFNGGSTEEFAEAFSAINKEKSEEFTAYVNENLRIEEDLDSTLSRSATTIPKIILGYNMPNRTTVRGAYADNMEWSTIGWYTGFCAATVAGFYMASYGGFWTRIAGCVAAAAGGVSMAVQLGKWCYCSDLGNFISSLMQQDAVKANDIAHSDDGLKIATICTETTVTAVLCYTTPFGKSVVNAVVGCYNMIVEKILTALPKGVSIIICGVPLHTI